jgi:Fic family protein
VHIHPFWDGNGRLARLLANIPLLKSGLPPLVIPLEERRAYIQLLAEYEIGVGQLNRRTGVWPNEAALGEFSAFCAQQYSLTMALLEKYSRQEDG